MEITARLHPSLSPLFSDHSHLVFYGCSSSTHCKPTITCLLHPKLSSSSPPASLHAALPPLRSVCQPSLCTMSACISCSSSIPSDLDLLQELAVLKAQVKLKKKQLKAVAKERKTALKEKKTKAKVETTSSSSSSSSSSESSDGGSMAVNMRLLKKDSSQNREEGGLKQNLSVRRGSLGLLADLDHTGSHGLLADVDHTETQQYRNQDMTQSSRNEPHGLSSRANSQSTRGFRDEAIADPPHDALGAGQARAISGSIEVCVGGKCKKAGSQQLLSSFKAQISASASVDAVPCKCMGKCGAAINVRVHKEDTNPQHHSHVSVDDAGLILNHHFGLGPPLSGLPCFSSLYSSSTPSICTAKV